MSTPIQNPFSKFSTTLLLAIFEAVCDYGPVHLPLQPLHPRYVLNLVCRTWFTVVRSTFSFWNNIHFTKPASGTVHQRHPILKQLAFCGKLSGLNPLTVTFEMICDGWGFNIVHLVIIPYAHRIKMLNGMISGNDNIFSFLTMGGSKFDILESVDICFVNTQHTPISSFPLRNWLQFLGLKSAPRLHKATFRLANGLHPLDLHLPWGQLTSLNLGTIPMTPEVFIKVLHSTSLRLENGFFCVRSSNQIYPHLVLSRHIVTMHALRTLQLMLFFPSQDTRLFSLLRLPMLQCLCIQMHDLCQDWDIPLYTKLVRASRKTLRKLSLEDYPPQGSENTGFVIRRRHRETKHHTLDQLFKVIPNIEKLSLPLGMYIHTITASKMASYALLPKLSFLEVSTLDGWPILAIVRRRHALALEATLRLGAEESEFETGCSQRLITDQSLLRPPTIIYMFIPRILPAEEKTTLVQEAQALGVLGTNCIIQSTNVLPLPAMNPRDVMRSRLLAWVDGVPQEPLVI